MKTKSLIVAVVILLSALAAAQSTPLSNDIFSVTLVGPAQRVDAGSNTNGTSSTVYYRADAPGVIQAVGARTLNGDIDVDQVSLDVYAANALRGGGTQDDRQYGTFQGHIDVYTNSHYTDPAGIVTRRRSLSIIVDSRHVILILQEGVAANDDGAVTAWRTLTDSLVLNEKTCWLPEGCK